VFTWHIIFIHSLILAKVLSLIETIENIFYYLYTELY